MIGKCNTGGGKPEEEKTVTAGTSVIEVLPSSGKVMKKVTINPTPSQSKTVTPSTSQQTVSPDSGKLLSQVIVKAMEDVTPEVTAQVPIIQGIAENFGVEIATPTGTNKQILQGNNANLQSIKTNAKKEGLYVWKKYSGKPKITAEIIVDFESIPEIYATTYLTVTSSDPLNLPVSELDVSSFDGLTITREGSDSYLFVFHGDGTTSENGGKGTFTYDKSKGRITWKPYAAWRFNNGWTFTPVIAQKTNELLDYVVSDSETAYPDGGEQGGYWYELYGSPINIVTWAGGTDEEIVAMVEAADRGEINLSDYWAVGDTRTVHLSIMSSTNVGETHAEQDIQLVLMHKGGYKLADGSTCNFVVGQKDALAETGYMSSTSTNSGSWDGSARRAWCNNEYKNAMPESLSPIFKQFKTITAKTYNGSTNQESVDYFALPAAKEVFGGSATAAGPATSYSNLNEFNSLFQFDYYKTTSNRVKKLGKTGSAYAWWERSPDYNNTSSFCFVNSGGSPGGGNIANATYGLAPFGCI